ncbi:hypothetical protein K1719_001754 [Acacia pycnantha]|nr:hypothetical protein K1719_001754 [Acacia pycnantha]
MASTVVKQLLTKDEDELLYFVPNDIIVDILKWLPVKSILRFRCVCKDWNDLFKTSSFIKQHFHHSIHGPSLLLQYCFTFLPDIKQLSLLDSEKKTLVPLNAPSIYLPSPNFLENKELITYENKLALLSRSELWIMEEEATSGGSEQRWNKEFISSACSPELYPWTIWREEAVFIAANPKFFLYLLNLTTRKVKEVLISPEYGQVFCAFNYAESLVSIANRFKNMILNLKYDMLQFFLGFKLSYFESI